MKRVIPILLFLFSFAAHTAEQRDFFQRLSDQEDAEYKALTDKIMAMDSAQYSDYLIERIEKAYEEKNALKSLIIVNVTEQVNQPEPGFWEKLFSSATTPEEYGIQKVTDILTASSLLPKSKSGADGAFVLKGQHDNRDKTQHYQQVVGSLTRDQAIALANERAVIDLHFSEDLTATGSYFQAINGLNGRVYPKRERKEYDQQFIKEGLYAELMDQFQSNSTLLVSIMFNEPLNVDKYISEWGDFEFQVRYKSENGMQIYTTKEHVEAMRKDKRVRTLRKGQILVLRHG